MLVEWTQWSQKEVSRMFSNSPLISVTKSGWFFKNSLHLFIHSTRTSTLISTNLKINIKKETSPKTFQAKICSRHVKYFSSWPLEAKISNFTFPSRSSTKLYFELLVQSPAQKTSGQVIQSLTISLPHPHSAKKISPPNAITASTAKATRQIMLALYH